MDWISLLLMAGFSVAAAIYTHYRLPFLTATRTQAGGARYFNVDRRRFRICGRSANWTQ